ncbi:MAG: type IIL restriction-modification enzyme MmeI, partial [Nannocystaceae bacterium]
MSRHLQARDGLALTWAVPDHPWPGSANVRVSIIVGEPKPGRPVAKIVSLNPASSRQVACIHADLTGGINLDAAKPLAHNRGRIFQGMNLVGTGFRLTQDQLRGLGYAPDNLPPMIRPYLNAREAMGRGPTRWVIDAYGWQCHQLEANYPRIYSWLKEHVFEVRKHNRRRGYRERWWIFGEPRRALREALTRAGQPTMVVTPETSRHRIFLPIHANICPDHTLHVLVGLDHFELGVLSSATHQLWARRMGGRQGAGNDTRYTSSRCFLTFPWPCPAPLLRSKIAEAMLAVEAQRVSLRASDPTRTLSKRYRDLRTAPELRPLASAH